MRILHAIDNLGRGGAERMLVEIANQSAIDGDSVSVCVTRVGDMAMASALDSRIEVLELGRKGRIGSAALWRLSRLLRRRSYEVVHLHTRYSLPFLAAARALARRRIALVLHDHYGSIETDTSVPLWFRAGKEAITHYVGVCSQLGEWARKAGIPSHRISVIENAIALERIRNAAPLDIRAELGIPASCLLGLMVANLRPEKGVDVLLDAVARVRATRPFKLLLAGARVEPNFERLRAQCERLGLTDTVLFLGSRPDVDRLSRSADFAVLSSHTESGPLALVEYMAAGLPFVATRVGEIGRELSSRGTPGFVPPSDAGAFAAELERLLALGDDERRQRGARGFDLCRSWDIRSVMPRWHDLYAHVKS